MAYLTCFDATWYADVFGEIGFTSCAKANPRNAEDRIRSVILDRSKRPAWNRELEATFESLLEIIIFCRARPSRRGIDMFGLALRGRERGRQRTHSDDHYPYCELCWRLVMASEAKELKLRGRSPSLGPSNIQPGKVLSKRFCRIHDPKSPKSKYRADHNYREAFHAQLRAFYEEIKTNRDCWIKRFGSVHVDEMREHAYRYVHIRSSENRIKAMRLARKGLSQSEISRHLGITRQAVSNLLRKIPAYFGDGMESNFPTKSSARR